MHAGSPTGSATFPSANQRKLVRTLQANGQYHLTKLGKAFFKDKYTEWLAHVPVIIRGQPWNWGCPDKTTPGARRRSPATSRKPCSGIYMISGETYFLHPTNEWAYSSSSMQVIDNRVDTQIRLRQPLGALREVSYQLFAGDQILASAFEERQDMLCVPRQIAELLKLPLQEVIEDFNSICPGNWQQRGVCPAEIRTFCVWRNAPMFYVDCLLEAGLAKWQHFKWSLDATAHVDQQCLEQVLQRMELGWPEGEEHYAKLAVNSLVGLFARNLELIYSMKTSNHQVDGEGCSWRQTFTDAAGRTHWDHIFVTELLSNSSYRPVHDFIMGAEYVAVARIRQALADVPRRYLKCIKTDCLVMQDVPKKHRPAVERLLQMSHRDGTPVYRYEEVAGLRGQYREPSMEAEPIRAKTPWRRVEDPVSHCLDGESLLLTGFPGTGKTHLAKKIVEALREHGAHHHQDPRGRAERGPGGARGGPLGAAEREEWALQRHLGGHRRAHAIRYPLCG